MPEQSRPASRATRILSVIGMAAGALIAGALVFIGHVALNADPTHRMSGDIVFAVVVTVPVLVVAGIAIAHQRAS